MMKYKVYYNTEKDLGLSIIVDAQDEDEAEELVVTKLEPTADDLLSGRFEITKVEELV
jgi:hypothetical protein